MGRKENIKRMKRMREEKVKRQAEAQGQWKPEQIAIDKLRSKFSSDEIVVLNTGPVKYSDVLKDFVEPFLQECTNFEEVEKLLSVGALAWNLAMTKQFEGEEAYKIIASGVKKEFEIVGAEHFLDLLIDRKTLYFAHYKVIFSNVVVTDSKPDFGLSVAVLPLSVG